MTAPPYMPLYVGDYLRDTLDFDAALSGAYLHLLMHAWTHDGKIPQDDRQLARITRLSRYRWKQHKTKLLAKFLPAGENFFQKRVLAELAKQLEFNETQRKKALLRHSHHKEKIITTTSRVSARSNGHANPRGATAGLSDEEQAELAFAQPAQRERIIPVTDELRYLVSRPQRRRK